MWHRREIRRVGLDEQTVERTRRDGLSHLLGALEGRNATEGEEGAELDEPGRLARSAAEAVDHRALGQPLFLEDREGVLPRVAGVHDERKVEPFRERDLLGERRTLRRSWRVLVEVVEAALANSDHLARRRPPVRMRSRGELLRGVPTTSLVP